MTAKSETADGSRLSQSTRGKKRARVDTAGDRAGSEGASRGRIRRPELDAAAAGTRGRMKERSAGGHAHAHTQLKAHAAQSTHSSNFFNEQIKHVRSSHRNAHQRTGGAAAAGSRGHLCLPPPPPPPAHAPHRTQAGKDPSARFLCGARHHRSIQKPPADRRHSSTCWFGAPPAATSPPSLASTLASTASPAGGTSGHRCADPGSGRARDGAAIKLGAHGGTTTDSPPATAHQEGDWCCARFEESGLRSAHRHRRGHSAESGGRGGRRGRRARRRETGGQQTCHTPRTDTRTDTL